MKICKFEHRNKTSWGVLKENLVFPTDKPVDFNYLAADQSAVETIKHSEVKFLSPVSPSKIVCVGRNYPAHAAELGNDVPKEPLLFLKAPSAIITDNESIVIPSQSRQIEHEGELGVVIGRDCKNIPDDEASLRYVYGYICLNDVTARDLQKKDVQFTRAKSFDTFCPVGAFIKTELDISDLRITTRVNGVIKQDGRTSQMVFPVDFLIRYISNQMTLHAGDLIATGTPAGVSRLNSGDVCEVEIEGIGILRNPVKS